MTTSDEEVLPFGKKVVRTRGGYIIADECMTRSEAITSWWFGRKHYDIERLNQKIAKLKRERSFIRKMILEGPPSILLEDSD